MSMRTGQDNMRFTLCHEMDGIKISRGIEVKHQFPVHTHDSYSFGIITRGIRTGLLNNKSRNIYEGQIFILNPAEPHSCQTINDRGHDYLVISISQSFLRSIYAQTSKTYSIPHFKQNIIEDNRFFQRILQCYSIFDYSSKLTSEIVSLTSDLIRHYGEEIAEESLYEQNYGAIIRAVEYVKAHYNQNISIANLAQIANLSPFYFSRVFHKVTGLSPHLFQIQIRIKQACNLLLNEESIANTAITTGFTDQSHFARFFKRMIGLTPLQYVYAHKEI